jgi:hypothetical protein
LKHGFVKHGFTNERVENMSLFLFSSSRHWVVLGLLTCSLSLNGCAWMSSVAIPLKPTPQLPVPASLQPAHARPTFTLSSKGVQIYECGSGEGAEPTWAFVEPQAELFNTSGALIGTHGMGPSWQAVDGSRLVGTLRARVESPRADALPWLLLSTRSTGSPGRFSNVTYVQRINTQGGMAPAAGCASADDAGKRVKVPFTADYVLFAVS